ncbi:hypothetical protein D9M72_560420 [compost metagenome]
MSQLKNVLKRRNVVRATEGAPRSRMSLTSLDTWCALTFAIGSSSHELRRGSRMSRRIASMSCLTCLFLSRYGSSAM